MKINEVILRQIELELSYAELKHPRQSLTLDKSFPLAVEKLTPIKACNRCPADLSGCDKNAEVVCMAFCYNCHLDKGITPGLY